MKDWAFLPRESLLRVQGAVEALAISICEAARKLPAAQMDDYIERELAKFAVQMRRYEGLGRTPAASIGYAVDVWLRECIAAALVEEIAPEASAARSQFAERDIG